MKEARGGIRDQFEHRIEEGWQEGVREDEEKGMKEK